MEKKLVVGILAHVDSGKTTLSESLLYKSGAIRVLGRVDKQNAFLDTFALEKERGITIFSKQAVFSVDDVDITLMDTPGHVDFSAEMERTLQILDAAILVISGANGVQGHTETLWRLLQNYQIPTFLFINKMDQQGIEKDFVLNEIRDRLHENCIDFTEDNTDEFYDQIAVCNDKLLDQYLSVGNCGVDAIREAVQNRECFPVFWGSALKCFGIEEFLHGLLKYVTIPQWGSEFGARVYKISRDPGGNRLTYMKVTGGSLKVRDFIQNEKVNQIRIYSGAKFRSVEEAVSGMVVAVTGLSNTFPGQGLGWEEKSILPVLEPVLTYALQLPEEYDIISFYPKCKQIEEEEPELHFMLNASANEIQVSIMGEVQLEILQRILYERFGVLVEFGNSQIVYKETIANQVEGVGHFEPLRHYAEVHLLISPGEPGSGVTIQTDCSEDVLAKNWQRLIISHLEEREFQGVLTGSNLTDVCFTVVSGRAHEKHTEGGDFRQATYRAVRQGLMQAKSVLLEPVFRYQIEVPLENIGRVLADIEKMYGTVDGPETKGEYAIISGIVPVATIQNYQRELVSFTKGRGRILTWLHGYLPCHNALDVINQIGYDSEKDLDNPSGSVFCAHGAGYVVPWNEVFSHMHVPALEQRNEVYQSSYEEQFSPQKSELQKTTKEVTQEKLDAIFEKTYGPVKSKRTSEKERIFSGTAGYEKKSDKPYVYKEKKKKKQYLLVDGYNVIFAWKCLKELAEVDLGAARTKLMDILSNYQGFRQKNVILVFDAYKLEGHAEEIVAYHNIFVVYTKEAETADRYIERCAHEMGHQYDVCVVTSDGIEQVIVVGAGCQLMSAKEFEQETIDVEMNIRTDYLEQQENGKRYLFDDLSEDVKKQLEDIHNCDQ